VGKPVQTQESCKEACPPSGAGAGALFSGVGSLSSVVVSEAILSNSLLDL
jgi:hypothetical protein